MIAHQGQEIRKFLQQRPESNALRSKLWTDLEPVDFQSLWRTAALEYRQQNLSSAVPLQWLTLDQPLSVWPEEPESVQLRLGNWAFNNLRSCQEFNSHLYELKKIVKTPNCQRRYNISRKIKHHSISLNRRTLINSNAKPLHIHQQKHATIWNPNFGNPPSKTLDSTNS